MPITAPKYLMTNYQRLLRGLFKEIDAAIRDEIRDIGAGLMTTERMNAKLNRVDNVISGVHVRWRRGIAWNVAESNYKYAMRALIRSTEGKDVQINRVPYDRQQLITSYNLHLDEIDVLVERYRRDIKNRLQTAMSGEILLREGMTVRQMQIDMSQILKILAELGQNLMNNIVTLSITETVRDVMRDSIDVGIKYGKKYAGWFTVLDQRVCDICGPLHAQIREVGDPFMFDRNGTPILYPPAHPKGRCGLILYTFSELMMMVRRGQLGPQNFADKSLYEELRWLAWYEPRGISREAIKKLSAEEKRIFAEIERRVKT